MSNDAVTNRMRMVAGRSVALYAGLALILIAGLVASPATAGARSLEGPGSSSIYDSGNNCINYRTSLPSVAGKQFRIYSPASAGSVAQSVADTVGGRQVFRVYEKGLGISSLRQLGQPGPFPIFIDPGLKRGSSDDADGVFAPLCQHKTWGAVAIAGTLKGDELAATAYHELFHAAQWAVLGSLDVDDSWWFEATATAAEGWFGSTDHLSYTGAVTRHPGLPMDHFGQAHEYGAYLFVNWVMQSDSMPSKAGWAFLRASIAGVGSHAPDWDAGLNEALSGIPPASPCDPKVTVLACEVASFWADETNSSNPAPRFPGVHAKLLKDVIKDTEETHDFPTPEENGALLVRFVPASGKNQMEIQVPELPPGVELWLNLGDGEMETVRPGETFDETFCRNGKPEGTHPLPKTGDVRMALTTTTDKAPAGVTVKFTSSEKCQAQGIMLYQGSVNGGSSPAALFESAACRRVKTADGGKQFKATAKSGAYKLQLSIKKFTGFHDYPIDFQDTDPSFVVSGPGGPFSNVYWPGGTPPNHGGYITFADSGLKMGLGFINAWNADYSDAILLAGALACNYSQTTGG